MGFWTSKYFSKNVKFFRISANSDLPPFLLLVNKKQMFIINLFIRAIACRWKFDEASSEYEKAWINFHDGLADYQFLCSPCNGKKSDKIDYIPNERNKDIKPYKNISTLYININDL